VASTLARENGGSFLAKTSAAALYSGARALQCPLFKIEKLN